MIRRGGMLEKLSKELISFLYNNKIDPLYYMESVLEFQNLASISRLKGRSFLINHIKEQYSSDTFLKSATYLLKEGFSSDLILDILISKIEHNYRYMDDTVLNLLKTQTIVSIAKDENPRIVTLKLVSILGEPYETMF